MRNRDLESITDFEADDEDALGVILVSTDY